MLRVQHHGLAPTRPGARVTDFANVQLPPVYVQYLSILILSVSILLFAGIFLSIFICSFLFFFRFIFLVGFYQRREQIKKRTSLPRISVRDHRGQYERKCSSDHF